MRRELFHNGMIPDFFPVPIILANDLRASLRKLSSLDPEFLRKSKFLSL